MSQFKYNLPDELIAKYPPKVRGTSNLLVLDKNSKYIDHTKYYAIPQYIQSGDVIVINETKVLNSRTYFLTPLNKRVEVLFLEQHNEKDVDKWSGLIGRAKNVEIGDILTNEDSEDLKIRVEAREGNGFLVSFVQGDSEMLFENYGHTPLPPYMKREDNPEDRVRYKTVFAKEKGAVAAPTASLNLTDDILNEIESKGAKIAKVELRVGWGTFAPIREEDIEDHEIHHEYISVSEQSANIINQAIKNNHEIFAFGTTVARTLESTAIYNEKDSKYYIQPYSGDTNLYIYPGYEWKIVNNLITNFHQPDSSLILLVSSFAGTDLIKKGYNTAIEKGYKFLSYGDSMLIKGSKNE